MTTAMSGTRTAAITMVNVRDVMWQIQADLRTLRAIHQMITVADEEAFAGDLTMWVYRGYAAEIQFWFLEASGVPRYGTTYSLERQWAGQPGGEAGGLERVGLSGTTFSLRVIYSPTWLRLTNEERQTFYKSLQRTWTPAQRVQTYGGSWTTDRTYASGALAATRSVYRAG